MPITRGGRKDTKGQRGQMGTKGQTARSKGSGRIYKLRAVWVWYDVRRITYSLHTLHTLQTTPPPVGRYARIELNLRLVVALLLAWSLPPAIALTSPRFRSMPYPVLYCTMVSLCSHLSLSLTSNYTEQRALPSMSIAAPNIVHRSSVTVGIIRYGTTTAVSKVSVYKEFSARQANM